MRGKAVGSWIKALLGLQDLLSADLYVNCPRWFAFARCLPIGLSFSPPLPKGRRALPVPIGADLILAALERIEPLLHIWRKSDTGSRARDQPHAFEMIDPPSCNGSKRIGAGKFVGGK